MLKNIFSAVIFVSCLILLTQNSFAMGGSPAPKEQTSSENTFTEPGQPAPSTSSAREGELNKARAEIKGLKAELEKVENYIWVIDGRIVEARKSRNAKKLVQLKELERETLERAEFIKGTIARKKNTYPELKASEDFETVKEKVAIPEQPVEIVAPEPQPQISGTIIYHEVVAGDTLMGISRKYYGTASMYKEIAEMNNLTGGLKQGMKLKIDLKLKNKAPVTPAL